MTDRPEGFYWLRDKLQPTRHPNPTCAYWNGHDWEFVGSDWTISEDDAEALGGMLFADRFEVVGGPLKPAP